MTKMTVRQDSMKCQRVRKEERKSGDESMVLFSLLDRMGLVWVWEGRMAWLWLVGSEVTAARRRSRVLRMIRFDGTFYLLGDGVYLYLG